MAIEVGPFRPHPYHGWHSGLGCFASAGSALTLCLRSRLRVTGLVAMNSLLAMTGGILAALVIGRGDPGFGP